MVWCKGTRGPPARARLSELCPCEASARRRTTSLHAKTRPPASTRRRVLHHRPGLARGQARVEARSSITPRRLERLAARCERQPVSRRGRSGGTCFRLVPAPPKSRGAKAPGRLRSEVGPALNEWPKQREHSPATRIKHGYSATWSWTRNFIIRASDATPLSLALSSFAFGCERAQGPKATPHQCAHCEVTQTEARSCVCGSGPHLKR